MTSTGSRTTRRSRCAIPLLALLAGCYQNELGEIFTDPRAIRGLGRSEVQSWVDKLEEISRALQGARDAISRCGTSSGPAPLIDNIDSRVEQNTAVALRLENGSATVNDARGAREASRELIRDARGLAISCGVLTPEMMDAPTAGVEWWDFSS